MRNKFLSKFFACLLILAVLFYSLASAAPAFAEGEEPPEAAPPAESEAVPEELPPGTEVVILDESGAVIPLVSTDAVEVLLTGDPMWCPAGIMPNTPEGDLYCTPAFDGFTGEGGLLYYLENNADLYTGAGTIYVADAYDSSVNDSTATEILIDGAVLMYLSDLAIQGGWDFTSNTISGYSDFYIPFIISNWGGNVDIYNLDIYGTSGDGLTVETTGDILVSDTDSGVNAGDGANLTSTNASVTVEDSQFYNNNNDGLNVSAYGDISLDNVYASWNGGNGANLYNTNGNLISVIGGGASYSNNSGSGLSIYSATGGISIEDEYISYNGEDGANLYAYGDITITDTLFEYNYGNGILAYADGNITLEDVGIYDNAYYYGSGAQLYADDISVYDSSFIENYWTGLYAEATGDILLAYVGAFDNLYSGAYLSALGNIWVEYANFDENGWCNGICYGDGLYAAASGNITAHGVGAYENAGYGLDLYAGGDIAISSAGMYYNAFSGAFLSSMGSISLEDLDIEYNGWWDGDSGLVAYAYNDIMLENVLSADNYGSGAYLHSGYIPFNDDGPIGGDIYVYDSAFFHNNYNGLSAETYGGSITLSNVEASYNNYNGAELYAGLNIWVGDESLFIENGWCNGDCYGSGLAAFAFNDIVLDEVDAYANAEYGAELYSGMMFTPFELTNVGNISVSNAEFAGNYDSGLYAANYAGDINLANVWAYENGAFGAELYTGEVIDVLPPAGGDINVTSSGFQNNFFSGLYASSGSNISLYDVYANSNYMYGAELYAGGDISVAGVAFTDEGASWFYDNGSCEYGWCFGGGLAAHAYGNISLLNVAAQSNYYGSGASLYSLGSTSVADSYFGSNDEHGLYASTEQQITLNNVYAIYNGLAGAELYSGSYIYVVASYFIGNGWGTNGTGIAGNGNNYDGLFAVANGDIIVEDSFGYSNAWDGAFLSSNTGSNLVICGEYVDNGWWGIEAYANSGSNTFRSVYFAGNSIADYSANPEPIIDNEFSCIPVPVTMLATGSAAIPLACNLYSQIVILMPNGDEVIFHCPTWGDKAVVEYLDGLPEGLPEGYAYLNGLDVSLFWGEVKQPLLGEFNRVTTNFVIPEELTGANLGILYWYVDPITGIGLWEELPGQGFNEDGGDLITPLASNETYLTLTGVHVNQEGLLSVTTNFVGIFALVIK